MKNSKGILVVSMLGGALAVASAARADDQGRWLSGDAISANVDIASDYIFRGISQTGEDPAIQGGLDYAPGNGLSLGVWGSNVDFGDEARAEIDIYGNFARKAGDATVNAGITYYRYPSTRAGYNFVEFSLGLGFDIGGATVSVEGRYTPDNFAGSGNALYLSSRLDMPLPAVGPVDLGISASIGHQTISDETAFGLADYIDWSAALIASYGGLDFAITYSDTDVGGCAACAARVVFSIGRGF